MAQLQAFIQTKNFIIAQSDEFFLYKQEICLKFFYIEQKMYIPNYQQTSNVVLLKIAKNHMIFTIDQTSTINMQYCMCFGLPKCNALNNIRVCE